jgi:hypothetical protein
MMRLLAGLALAVALGGVAAPAAVAQVSEGGSYDGFQLFVENDKFNVFRRSDQWYTNGIRLVTLPRCAPAALLQRYADWVGNQFGDGRPARFGLTIGQDIYTPKDITRSEAQPYDRPWAGWLYAGAIGSLVVTPERQHTVELDLGIVGPAAGARWVQSNWHKLIRVEAPRGWNHQLHNELGVILNHRVQYRQVLLSEPDGRTSLDILPFHAVALGNVYTHAQAGLVLRYGRGISGFGDDRASNTVPRGAAGQDGCEPNAARLPLPARDWNLDEWYVFAKVDGKLVARNIFLDGNSFRSSARVKREPFVGDMSFGVSVRFRDRLRVTYAQNIRSQEFKGTADTPRGDHRFASLILAYEF